MRLSPDSIIFWQKGIIAINGTVVFTWLVMAIMVLASWLVTRKLNDGTTLPRWQNFLETIVTGIRKQVEEVTHKPPDRFIPLLGTLFLFIAVSNTLSILPGFEAPTGSLSTTAALAICVLIAVPAYGIAETGLLNYLKNYVRPTPMMLPFNITGEISRTLALAVRLFGNVMSGSMIAGILLAIAPLLFPVIMQLLGLLTGLVQAYIFAILAAVYIAAGMEVHEKKRAPAEALKEIQEEP